MVQRHCPCVVKILSYYNDIMSIRSYCPLPSLQARARSQRGEKQVIDRKSKEREVTESGFPLTFSRNFSRHVRALDAPSFFELFHFGERRNARARPAKFLWNLSLGPGQVQIRLFAREMHPTFRIIILTDRDPAVVARSSRCRRYHKLRLNASMLNFALLVYANT